nr:carbohydrate kinase [uncultured Dethiosulfovibrio sp.]
MDRAILCAGEALVDLISLSPGTGLGESSLFESRLGGAPMNVAIGARRLGASVGFLGKIGCDPFGDRLWSAMEGEGLDLSPSIREGGTSTTLAFVAMDRDGKPQFRFYRDNAADVSLKEAEVASVNPSSWSCLSFGSISLLEEPSSSTYLGLFGRFMEAGVITAYDPNVRPLAIDRPKRFRAIAMDVISKADIVKVSDDDLRWLCPNRGPEESLMDLPISPRSVAFLTLGAKGAMIRKGETVTSVPAYPVEVKDTTGCGDAFMAAILVKLGQMDREGLHRLPQEYLTKTAAFGCAAASVVAGRIGAAFAMGTLEEVISRGGTGL